jgi:hypothetical protein
MKHVPEVWIGIRFAVVLSVVILSSDLSQVLIAADAGDFISRVQKWKEWRDHISHWPVDTTLKMADGSPDDYNQQRMKFAGKVHYCLEVNYKRGKRKERLKTIRNPRYRADLAIGLDDRWILTALSKRGEGKFLTSLEDGDGMNLFDARGAGGWFIKKILEAPDSFVVATSRDGEVEAFTLTPKPREDGDRGAETPKVFGVFSQTVMWFNNQQPSPFRIDTTHSVPSKQVVTQTRVLDDWVEVKQVPVPKRVRVYMPGGFTIDSEPVEVAHFDYSTIDMPVSARECYLSYYGIPEPEGTGGIDYFYIVMAGIGLVLCGVGVYYWRRAP